MERKETLQTLSGEKIIGVPVANSQLTQQPKEKIKIRGITTSRVNHALKAFKTSPYPARVFIREPNKNCLTCSNRYEDKECSSCQIPVFFRIKCEGGN